MVKSLYPFRVESLTELSQVQVCKQLWSYPKIIKSVNVNLKKYLSEDDPIILTACDEYDDYKILNQVFNNIERLVLPPNLKQDLKILAKKVGFVIWDRIEYMHDRRDIFPINIEKYLDYIKWNKDWDIDATETIRSMYYAKILPDSYNTWVTLTNCCLEDCILHYFKRVRSVEMPPIENLDVEGIVPLYWTRRLQNRLDDFSSELNLIRWYDWNEESESMEEDLLQFSISWGIYPAIQYFWQVVNDDQRIKALSNYIEGMPEADYVSAIFILKQASLTEMGSIFIKIFGRLDLRSRFIHWPYRNLLMKCLEVTCSYISDFELEQMIETNSRGFHFLYTYSDRRECMSIFQKIWCRIGGEYKKSMDSSGYVDDFWTDAYTLNYIINDEAVKSKREEYVMLIANKYKRFHSDQDISDIIYNFCRVVLKTDEERQAFTHRVCIFPCQLTLDDVIIDDLGDFEDFVQ